MVTGLDRVRSALPYLLIVVPALFAELRDWRPELLAVVVFAGAWHWVAVDARPAWPGRASVRVWARVWGRIAYFVVMLAAVAVLVRADPLFTVTGLGVFVQAFALLPGWWAYGGVAATAGVLVAARPPDGRSPGELGLSFVVAVLVASMVGLLVRTISDQNDQRKVMIAKLALLAEENAGLQARLLAGARDAGVLQERHRMAREIHDTVAQGLTAILTQLEAAGETLDDQRATRARVDTVRTLARRSLTEARRSVQALRPAPLEEAQLEAALHDVAARWTETSGVPASVSVTGDPRPLHTEVEATLLRVAQEALANVAKHATAGRAGLTLSYMEDVVALDVRDDGAGFTPVRQAAAGSA